MVNLTVDKRIEVVDDENTPIWISKQLMTGVEKNSAKPSASLARFDIQVHDELL